jgi:chromosome segregation ATPase
MNIPNEEYITLKKASEITGLKVQTLRMRLINKKIEGYKSPSKYGVSWFVKIDSIRDLIKVDPDTLKLQNLNTSKQKAIKPFKGFKNINEALFEAKEEQIQALQNNLLDKDKLLTVFQERIQNIEAEKAILEDKLKLLPAPPEELAVKMQAETDRAEQAEKQAQEAQEAVKQAERDKEAVSNELDQTKDSVGIWQAQAAKLEEELKSERALSWWKKLFRR